MRSRSRVQDTAKALARRVRLARARSRLTQIELAQRIRAKCPVAYKTSTLKQLIWRLERGYPIPYRDELIGWINEIIGPLDHEDLIVDVDACWGRPVALDVSRDGTVTFRRWDSPPLCGGWPMFSVASEHEARRMQWYLCDQMRVTDPLLPGQPWFVFTKFTEAIFSGVEFDDLIGPTMLEFADAYETLRKIDTQDPG